MKIPLRKAFIVVCAVATIARPALAQVQAGRYLGDRETFRLYLDVGQAYGLDGEVQETTRPIEVAGLKPTTTPPENYSWHELGFDDNFPLYGLGWEKLWKYVTFNGRLVTGRPELSGTANRDYYLGVGDITYRGREYEYMKIPRGTQYEGEIDTYTLNLALRITPFSLGNEEYYTEFTPWIHLGLFNFLGDYEIRAGRAQGVVEYENPPREYVVGGTGSGMSGLVVPEYGLGGEFRFYLAESAALYLMGNVALLNLSGSTGDLGISTRNEKNVDVDYQTLTTRLLLEIEMTDSTDFLIGIEYQNTTADASSRAKIRSAEEAVVIREKLDKDITFEMNTLMGLIGFRF